MKQKTGITLSDYTFFDSDLSYILLHLLKVSISNGIITAAVLRALINAFFEIYCFMYRFYVYFCTQYDLPRFPLAQRTREVFDFIEIPGL